jgi:copper homeostasis protein
MKLEVCVENLSSALIAQENGATGIEFCDNLLQGGTTPSAGAIRKAKELLKIPFHVMIRPRGGDFYYSDVEFQIMKEDICFVKSLGVYGIVLGFLTKDGVIDVQKTRECIQLARPMHITFHRAFDVSKDLLKSLETLIELGVDRILTSGGESSALEGLEVIEELVKQADNRIQILPGGGITRRNLKRIVEKCNVPEIHMAIPKTLPSEMVFRNSRVFMGTAILTSEFELTVADGNVVRDVVNDLSL